MMRILVLTNLYPGPCAPNRAAFNRQQFAALAQQHEVRVIAPIAWTDEISTRRTARADGLQRRRMSDGMIIDHPRYLFTPRFLRGWYGRFVVRSVRASFQAAVREARPDVVLGCWAYPDGWAAVKLAREAGLPVVVKVHGSDLLSLKAHPSRLARTKETLAQADAVVAVSRHLRERAIKLGAEESRVRVVYNGVDRQLFQPGPRQQARQRIGISGCEPLILFVGNLVGVKGIDVLIDALASVAARGIEFRCAIVGQGPLKAELQAQIDELGLSDCVGIIGPRPLEELPQWYQAADFLVLPSHSEGVPNVLLEAAACGTPFIASRVGGIPEIASSDSLVPPGDSSALSEKILSFIQSPRDGCVPTNATSWADSAGELAEVLDETVTRARRQARGAA